MKIKIDLKKYNIDLDEIKLIYKINSNFYHNFNHIKNVIKEINKFKYSLSNKEYRILIITALYHDIVYIPLSPINELKSCEYIDKLKLKEKEKKIIKNLILFTEYKTYPINKLQNIFLKCDMSIFSKNIKKQIKYENNIRLEYSMIPDEIYYKERIKILKNINRKYNIDTNKLIKILNGN